MTQLQKEMREIIDALPSIDRPDDIPSLYHKLLISSWSVDVKIADIDEVFLNPSDDDSERMQGPMFLQLMLFVLVGADPAGRELARQTEAYLWRSLGRTFQTAIDEAQQTRVAEIRQERRDVQHDGPTGSMIESDPNENEPA